MQLNDMEYCRCFSFLEALKLEHSKPNRLALLQSDSPLPLLNEQAILALRDTTLENASNYAARFFPNVEFEVAPADEVPFIIEDEIAPMEFFPDREPTEAELEAAANYILKL